MKVKPKKSRARRLIMVGVIEAAVILLIVFYLGGVYYYMRYKTASANVFFPDTPHIETLTGQGQGTLKLTVLGDSLALGVGASSPEQTFPYQVIRAKLVSQYATIQYNNRAFSGYKVADTVTYSLDTAIKDQPDLVMIAIGANDVTGLTDSDKYIASLKTLLDRLTTETSARVVLLGIPAIKTATVLIFPYPQFLDFRTNQLIEAENNLLKNYPADRVTFVELYNSTGPDFARNQPDLFAADGFHPNDQGYTVWAREVEKVL